MRTYIWVDIILTALTPVIAIATIGRERKPRTAGEAAVQALVAMGFIIWGLFLVAR